VREAPAVDQRSGVSARFAIAAVETVAASAVRRAAVAGEPLAVARVADLPSVVAASRGKVEFEDADEDRELELLAHLLRRATAETFRARLAGVDLSPLQRKFDEGATVETGDMVPAAELLRQIGPFAGLSAVVARLETGGGTEDPGMAAAAVEFALEGLYLNRRLSKDSEGGRSVYGGS
jgi:magnesium chelatase subunit I